jgi:hypothetical protein
MEVTRPGWSERTCVIGDVLKFGVSVQRVQIPPNQSKDLQVGSEPSEGEMAQTGQFSRPR